MTDPVTKWWDDYGAAWEARDGEACGANFTDDAAYHWTPFDEPQRGPAEIAAATNQAMSTQRDVEFTYDVLFAEDHRSVVRWRSELTRVRTGAKVTIDGIGYMELAADGRATVFREWWHRKEEQPSDGRVPDQSG
jgi:hypothetical protein